MTIRALAFDAFGTLVKIGEPRSPYRQLMQWMLDKGRLPRSNDAARVMTRNISLVDLAEEFGMSPDSDVLASWERQLNAELQSVLPFPDTLDILTQLRQAGYRIGLCSNLASPYGEPIRALLPTFDAYALSYEVGALKPDPAIYRHLIDQLHIEAHQVLFVGDNPIADRDGPEAFGMQARLIDRRAGQRLDEILTDLLRKPI